MTEYEIAELLELVEMAEECALAELAAFGSREFEL